MILWSGTWAEYAIGRHGGTERRRKRPTAPVTVPSVASTRAPAAPAAGRVQQEVEAAVPGNWDTRNDHLLGTDTDRSIASKTEVSKDTVFRRRKQLGIPAWGTSRPE